MNALAALALLLVGSLASAGPADLNDLLGTTGEFEKQYDTSSTVVVNCSAAKVLRLMPRKSSYELGHYTSGTKFWLDKIVFIYADGSQSKFDSGTFLDLVRAYNDDAYDVPTTGSCLQSIVITGRPDCKMSAGRSCSAKSVVVDVYSAQ